MHFRGYVDNVRFLNDSGCSGKARAKSLKSKAGKSGKSKTTGKSGGNSLGGGSSKGKSSKANSGGRRLLDHGPARDDDDYYYGRTNQAPRNSCDGFFMQNDLIATSSKAIPSLSPSSITPLPLEPPYPLTGNDFETPSTPPIYFDYQDPSLSTAPPSYAFDDVVRPITTSTDDDEDPTISNDGIPINVVPHDDDYESISNDPPPTSDPGLSMGDSSVP